MLLRHPKSLTLTLALLLLALPLLPTVVEGRKALALDEAGLEQAASTRTDSQRDTAAETRRERIGSPAIVLASADAAEASADGDTDESEGKAETSSSSTTSSSLSSSSSSADDTADGSEDAAVSGGGKDESAGKTRTASTTATTTAEVNPHDLFHCAAEGVCDVCGRFEKKFKPYCFPWGNKQPVSCLTANGTVVHAFQSCPRSVPKERKDFYVSFALEIVLALGSVMLIWRRRAILDLLAHQRLMKQIGVV